MGRPVRKVAVLNDYQSVAMDSADWSAVGELAEVDVFTQHFASTAEAVDVLADHEVICVMRERLPLGRELLTALPNLRCVVTTGAANRSIDLDAAADLGVVVSGTTNGMGRLATAELTWGLVLATVRRIPQEDRAVRDGRWQTSVGTTLRGLTLGIAGLGGVGRYVARYARAFDMEVIAWSRNLTPELAAESQAEAVTKDELFRRSDVITLHTVLSSETVGMVGHRELAQVKPTAHLVNTSRGPLVDEAALVAALREGRLAGAALDAFDVEPLPRDHPYLDLPGLILSPHLGYVTGDVYDEFFAETVRSTLAWLQGSPIRLLTPGGQQAPAARRYEDV